jgi:hypothetical protein
MKRQHSTHTPQETRCTQKNKEKKERQQKKAAATRNKTRTGTNRRAEARKLRCRAPPQNALTAASTSTPPRTALCNRRSSRSSSIAFDLQARATPALREEAFHCSAAALRGEPAVSLVCLPPFIVSVSILALVPSLCAKKVCLAALCLGLAVWTSLTHDNTRCVSRIAPSLLHPSVSRSRAAMSRGSSGAACLNRRRL